MARRSRAFTWGLPAAGLVLAAFAGACSHSSSGSGGSSGAAPAVARSAVSRSSTIATAPSGHTLWLTSPDDDQVVELSASTLAVRRRVAVPGQPQELTVLHDLVLVTGSQSNDLTVLSTGGAQVGTSTITLPCGGSRAVVAVPAGTAGAAHPMAVVTCPTDDVVAVVDLQAGAVAATFPVAGRPTGIVLAGTELTVSTAGSGTLRRYDLAKLLRSIGTDAHVGVAAPMLEVHANRTTRAWADGERSASTLSALDAGPRGPVGVYQVVDNVRKLSSAELAGDAYGTPMNGRARLEPALTGPCGARFASFTDPGRLLSGPVALAAAPRGDLVWVVGQFSHSVSVVRCSKGAAASRTTTVASFDVGAGARGIAVAADGRRAFVDVGFDHEVAELRLPATADRVGPSSIVRRRAPVSTVHRTVRDRHLSALAQEGRKMFTDATDTHLTPFGVVTCASCHPGAGDDGLSWRIETKTIARKFRRTPAAWQIDPEVKPLHWDGEFTTSDDLVLTTVQQLLGGDGLLVDTAAISAYLAEAPAPPAAPAHSAAERALVEQGKAVFESSAAACSTCHAGPAGTDGLAHAALPRTTDQAADLPEAVTPPLFGVRGKAPYGHDGRAADLDQLLGLHLGASGAPIELTAAERAAVIAYLRSR